MTKDVTIYFEDIVNSITHIEKYTHGASLDVFEADEYMQDAIIRRFQIIGDATKRIPDDFKQRHSNVPWKFATAMRDVLVHDYNEVNLERVWKTIKEDLPEFKEQIQILLQETEKNT